MFCLMTQGKILLDMLRIEPLQLKIDICSLYVYYFGDFI